VRTIEKSSAKDQPCLATERVARVVGYKSVCARWGVKIQGFVGKKGPKGDQEIPLACLENVTFGARNILFSMNKTNYINCIMRDDKIISFHENKIQANFVEPRHLFHRKRGL
jgi:hypothetical protein